VLEPQLVIQSGGRGAGGTYIKYVVVLMREQNFMHVRFLKPKHTHARVCFGLISLNTHGSLLTYKHYNIFYVSAPCTPAPALYDHKICRVLCATCAVQVCRRCLLQCGSRWKIAVTGYHTDTDWQSARGLGYWPWRWPPTAFIIERCRSDTIMNVAGV
jgi:hypothetical protein